MAGKKQRIIIFVHIARCAGSSTKRIFMDFNTKGDCYWISLKKLGLEGWNDCSDETQKALDKGYIRIGGHMLFKPLPDRNDIDYLTIMRDPVKRVFSFYHWYKFRVKPDDGRINKGIEYFLDIPEEKIGKCYKNNLMTHIISGGTRKLDDAINNLSRFKFIGLVERWSDTLDILHTKFRLSVPPPEAVHVQRNDEKPEKINKRTRNKISQLNQDDIVLYEEAKKRFNKAIK